MALAALLALGLAAAAQPVPAQAGTEPGYITPDDLARRLQEVAENYPDITRLYSLGPSTRGHELWAMVISDAPAEQEAEPEFKYVATMHGDEPVGTELMVRLIDRLTQDYDSDPRIAQLVDSTEIWIVPLMNPDGYERRRRANFQGIDLNRSFPVFPDDYTGTVFDGEALGDEGRATETQLVMQWAAENSFVLSANLHTGALVVNYPYDDAPGARTRRPSPTPDELLIRALALNYAARNPALSASTRFPGGVTNGADWFVIKGGMQDWNYRYLGCIEVTLELAEPKAPPASQLPALWAENEEALLAYIEAVHQGVRGIVRDRTHGGPLYARVTVEDNPQPVFSDADLGDYYRLLLPGTYTLRAEAAGYIAYRSTAVTVGDSGATFLDFSLSDGDVDGNGRVAVTDVQRVVQALLRGDTAGPADVDGLGISATDLQAVINAALAQ